MLASKLLVVILALGMLASDPMSYRAQIERWRQQREDDLKAENGWLTVVGLFWLREGESTVGTGRGNTFVLPAGSGPAKVGTFVFHDCKASFHAAPGVPITLNGRRVDVSALTDDSTGAPDVLSIGSLSMYVIHRGRRYGVRVKDNNSEARRKFTGTRWFPVAEQYRLVAKFVPYTPPKKITVPNILGDMEQDTSPGYLEFTLQGQRLRLDPVVEEDHLFIIFKDLTSGKETYPPGRFLYAEMPQDGRVILDFNQAIDPPCAFTPYATCPLPPSQNRLPIRIEAGELRYGH